MRRWLQPLGFVVLALACAGCDAQSDDRSRSSGMFSSLFGGKKIAKVASTVGADVGAALVREQAFPPPAAAPAASFGRCDAVGAKGTPPEATFIPEWIDGQSVRAWKISGLPGQPPLAVVNVKTAPQAFQIWELDASGAKLSRRRTTGPEPGQAPYASQVACLPASQLLVAVSPDQPAKDALYRYDAGGDRFQKIATTERDVRDLDKSFETLAVASDAVLVLYYTDKLRLAPEVYTNTHNHVMLFSARYPKGIEILDLGNDDGSIRRWTVIDKKLWLDTIDWRKQHAPLEYVWSLDLAKVL